MQKNWIWLVLFGVAVASGAFLWWSGKSSPPAVETPLNEETAPVLEPEAAIEPMAPESSRRGEPEAPPSTPDYKPPTPNYETFSPPANNSYAPPPETAPGFENMVPPQNFENPDFVTPPPPPTQFDSEAVPFDENAPAFDTPPPMQEDLAPPLPAQGEEF
jgi:hypothetical protein